MGPHLRSELPRANRDMLVRERLLQRLRERWYPYERSCAWPSGVWDVFTVSLLGERVPIRVEGARGLQGWLDSAARHGLLPTPILDDLFEEVTDRSRHTGGDRSQQLDMSMADPVTDAELLAAIPDDAAALEAFYRRYVRRVMGFA